MCLKHIRLVLFWMHVQMLTNLESKLEEYLVTVDSMPTEYAEGMEKSREKERRKGSQERKK